MKVSALHHSQNYIYLMFDWDCVWALVNPNRVDSQTISISVCAWLFLPKVVTEINCNLSFCAATLYIFMRLYLTFEKADSILPA